VSEGIRLYAGTQEGLFSWQATNGGWQEQDCALGRGIVEALAACPQHPQYVFAGLAHDGLYRTDDGGKRWTKVLDGDVRSVDVDPTDDAVLYAGTEPVHLYRSEDRGDSWEEITSLGALPEAVRQNWNFPLPPHQGHTIQTFVHTEDSSLLYLCIEHGGILRSFDRGASWEDVSGGIDYLDIHYLANAPHRRDRYFVSSARGFYTSDDPARGWVRAENGCTRNYFHDFVFLSPTRESAAPTMILATADQSPGYWPATADYAGAWNPNVRGSRAALFRSQDLAQSWQRSGEGLPDELDPMIWALIHHPTDDNAVFGGMGEVSRGHVHGTGGAGTIVVTRDRGDTWQPLDLRLPAIRKLAAVPA
jgi:photosystem II stability/assembly factor-like uncharacterized protein